MRKEIVPVEVKTKKGTFVVEEDEQIQNLPDFDKLRSLPTLWKKEGTCTAGNAGHLGDGAAAMLLVSGKYAKENNFMNIFYMNNETGGRMSVCSAIGMVPSAFAKIDFEEFLKGQSHSKK